MPVRNLQILVVLMVVCLACYMQAERLKYAGKLGSAIIKIKDHYVDEIDPQDLYMAAMQGMVSELDQFSEFIPPAKYAEFQTFIEQQFGGLGILVEGPPAAPQLTVVAPIPGTPAFKAGMLPGDVILRIGDRSTEGLLASDATGLMRGPVGEPVTLQIRRQGLAQPLDLSIRRADIQVDSVYGDRIRSDSSWDYFLQEDSRIAYIRVTLFGEKTVSEFAKALATIKDSAQAVILDLRFNPGGILPSAVEMCDMLLDHGTVVSTRGRNNRYLREFTADRGVSLDLKIPMVVMVNDHSASASEIMAGCLQDLGRATVVGERSYGKGTVQQVFQLENDQTALKFTTARFYRPSGKNIHRGPEMTPEDEWGVAPQPALTRPLSDLEELYLHVRWRHRGDPRLMSDAEHPPAPPLAGDPQLKLAVDFLQQKLSGE